MKRKWLAVGIILLFIGVAVAPTIHFNTVNASTNNIQEERITPKELLFQTILDVANNREIQKIVSTSEMQSKGYVTPQVLTKNYLNSAYRIGLILTKILGVNRIHSLIQRYQITNSEVQKDISDVIERNPTLKMEMIQLSSVSCGCENENTTEWRFPIICNILFPIFIFAALLWLTYPWTNLMIYIGEIGKTLNCWWAYAVP